SCRALPARVYPAIPLRAGERDHARWFVTGADLHASVMAVGFDFLGGVIAASNHLVLHSVAAPARINRAVLPLIQNSVPGSAYRPPSAERACGSVTVSPLPAKVSRTAPVGPGALKTARTAVPSTQR